MTKFLLLLVASMAASLASACTSGMDFNMVASTPTDSCILNGAYLRPGTFSVAMIMKPGARTCRAQFQQGFGPSFTDAHVAKKPALGEASVTMGRGAVVVEYAANPATGGSDAFSIELPASRQLIDFVVWNRSNQ